MSYTIYIAHEGGKENPISLDDWKAASGKFKELTVRNVIKRNGSEAYEVFLPGARKKYLWLNPYGVAYTQAPTEEMMRVVFSLAAELNAGVYNENFKRYSSVEDWERKTRHERKVATLQLQEAKARRFKHAVVVVGFLCLCLIFGWLIGEYT